MMSNAKALEWSGRASDLPDRSRAKLGPSGPSIRDPSEAAGETRLVVAIPTANRPAIVAATVRDIARQNRLPDMVIVSLSAPEDIGDLDADDLPFRLKVVTGRKGLSAQRNRALEELYPDDIVLMLDDDFLMAPNFIENTLDVFRRDPEVVVATGTVLADGIHGPGYSHDQGRKMLSHRDSPRLSSEVKPTFSGYGCNLALRVSAVAAHEIWFDEELPLYSWLEDLDFSRRLSRFGKVVRSGAMRGVHLGTKTGRTPGLLLGYSQIANPRYLVRKGSVWWPYAYQLMGRNLLSNLIHSIYPPAHIDFRGRLRGNFIAIRDIFRKDVSPLRILELRKR